jgi:hypothetical protein
MRRLFLLLLVSLPSFASIGYVHGCVNSASAASVTCAITGGITSGNLLVVMSKTQVISSTNPVATISVSSSSGVSCTWSVVQSPQVNSNGAYNTAEYYCVAPSTGAETVQVSWTGTGAPSSPFTDIAIAEYNSTTGWQSPALDVEASTVTINGGSVSCSTGTTAATTNANDLVVATCGNWNAAQTYSGATGYTQRAGSERNTTAWFDKTVTSTGTQTAAITQSAQDGSIGIIAAFMTASGGGGGTTVLPRMTLLGVGP